MIPDFDENGYLPPGIHPATIEEIDERFGRESEMRRSEMQSLRWLIDLARKAGILRIVINGSFVTDVFEPNDLDCVLLIKKGFELDEDAEGDIVDGLPFLQVEMVYQRDFDAMVNRVYAFDRIGVAKGVVEIVSWT